VNSTSASIGTEHERLIPVNRNHLSICKFYGYGDDVYKRVLAEIGEMLRSIRLRGSSGYATLSFVPG
jgi:hypothetical protein